MVGIGRRHIWPEAMVETDMKLIRPQLLPLPKQAAYCPIFDGMEPIYRHIFWKNGRSSEQKSLQVGDFQTFF